MTDVDTVKIVVICSGNICRSPMAEALLAHDLAVRGVSARVTSVGTLDLDSPADPLAVQVVAERGIDISPHRSHVMTEQSLTGADLVIGMAREHVRAAALVDPSVYARAFTLRELVRRAQSSGGPARGEPVWSWGVHLTADRRFTDLLGDSPVDDIEDPIGQNIEFFRYVAAEIAGLSAALAVTIAAGRSVDADRRA
jgi:protein-tyrosine phosphatase